MPSESMRNPTKFMPDAKNLDFCKFRDRFAVRSRHPTSRSSWSISSMVAVITTISSMYTITRGSRSCPITRPIKRHWVAGALLGPKGITQNWNRPLEGTLNAVNSRLDANWSGLRLFERGTCQKALVKSITLKYFAFGRRANIRGIFGTMGLILPRNGVQLSGV